MQPLSSSRAGWTYTWMHALVWLPPWSKNKTFHHSRRLSLATFLTLTIPPTREPLFDSFHCGIILLDFERIHINEIKILCLASFTQLTFVGFICDVRWFDSSFSLLHSIPLIWIYHSLFSHWWIFGLSVFFSYYESSCYENHLYLFVDLCTHLCKLLGHGLEIRLTFIL